MNVDSSFDFKTDILIIGAGSAGCSVAAGLIDGGAVDPAGITIVESGSIDRPHQRHPDIRQPAGYPRRFGSSDDWAFSAQGGAGVSHRKIAWPRGRGVGGSTRINAMIWLPPPPHDVAQLLTHLREPRGRHRDDDLQSLHAMWDRSFQCVSQRIQAESPRYLSEPVQFFLQAATDAARSPLAYQRMNRRGQRTGAETMIASSMDEIRFVGGTVSEVLFDGDRAIGVRCDNGRTMLARRAVFLCGGTIGSPMMLMRSGIGPGDCLRDVGISVRRSLDAVGENLSDHFLFPMIYETAPRHRFPTDRSMRDMARWQHNGSGPLVGNLAEAGLLTTDANPMERAQWFVTPTHYLRHPSSSAPPAMSIGVSLCHPSSRGRVRIQRCDTGLQANIDAGYFAESSDRDLAARHAESVREFVREHLSTIAHRELVPGEKTWAAGNRDRLQRSIARYALSLYHPCGTCALGRVVNARFAIDGIAGLHIVDASVLPRVPAVNPNAMVMTLGYFAGLRFGLWE